jgi:hypothetical protein
LLPLLLLLLLLQGVASAHCLPGHEPAEGAPAVGGAGALLILLRFLKHLRNGFSFFCGRDPSAESLQFTITSIVHNKQQLCPQQTALCRGVLRHEPAKGALADGGAGALLVLCCLTQHLRNKYTFLCGRHFVAEALQSTTNSSCVHNTQQLCSQQTAAVSTTNSIVPWPAET